MDKRVQAELSRITRNIPPELKTVTKEVVDTEEEDRILAMIKDPSLGAAQKRKLTDLVRKGAFRSSETVVDEEKVKKLDEYHTREIAAARKSGRLPDPKTDPFFKKRQWLARNRQHGNS